MPSEIPMWWSLALSVILFLAWRQFQRQRQQKRDDDAAPLRTLAVEISALRAEPRTRTVSRAQPLQPDIPQGYTATFRPLPQGEAITLRLSEAQYRPLAQGMRGTLQVQGARFVAFDPDAD